jgi:surface polysaccharide O-acyltransferase-like enzyme
VHETSLSFVHLANIYASNNGFMKRLAWIDNLRVMVIILVVFLHSAVTYSGLGGWYYKENEQVDMLSMIIFAFFQTFTQAYFMSLLFLVSGYFTALSLERKGAKQFLTGRLKRLGIPLLLFIFLIQPVAVKLAYPDLDILDWYIGGIKSLDFLGWTGPLWFVEALLIFTVIYLILNRFGVTVGNNTSVRLINTNVFAIVLLITGIAFMFRLAYPMGTDFYNLQFSYFSAYMVMFTLGIASYHNGLFDRISLNDGRKWLWISLGLGIPAWMLIIFFGGPMEGVMLIEGGWNWPAFFYALWESFFCVTFIIALVGLFKYKMNISGRFQKFLSDNAFGVFVFHAPVLIAISMLLKGLELHPVVKFLLVGTLAVVASFLVSWIVRRVGMLRRIFS